MVSIVLNNKIVVLHSVISLLELVEDFAEAEMGWHTRRVQLDTVSKVLFSFEKVATVCQLSGEVDAGAEVALVDRQALFEVENRLLELFNPLILTAEVEMGLQSAFLVAVGALGVVEAFLKSFKCFIILFLLFKDSAHQNVCFRQFRVNFDDVLNQNMCFSNLGIVSQVDLPEFEEDISVIWVDGHCGFKGVDSECFFVVSDVAEANPVISNKAPWFTS